MFGRFNYKKRLEYLLALKNSNIGLRLGKGLFWNTLAVIISRAFILFASIIVARVLGKESYGQLGIIQSTVSMFGVFAGLGLGLTSTKFLAEYKIKDKDKAGRIISLSNIMAFGGSTFISVILIIFTPFIAIKTLASPELIPFLRLSTILLFFSTLNGVQLGILTGLEKFKDISKINFVNGIISFIMLSAGTYFFHLNGAVWALNISIITTYLLSSYLVKRQLNQFGIKLNYATCWPEKRFVWDFSIPAFLSGLLIVPVNWLCYSILVNQNNGYAEMGIYNATNQWFTILLFFPSIVSSTMLPILTEKVALKESNKSSKLLKYSILLNGFLVGPFILVFILFSSFIMGLYGIGFMGRESVLIYTLITAGLYAIQSPVGNLIAASNSMWLGLIMNLVWGSLFILFFLLFEHKSAESLALARSLAYTFHFIGSVAITYHILKK